MTNQPFGQRPDLTTFGGRLDVARREAALSQADLARKLNIDAKSVGAYINGTSKPLAHRVTQIAKILGVTETWLVTGEEGESELIPAENEYEAILEQARHAFAKRNGVPVEQVEMLFQIRFPPSPVGRVFPA
jgi:transcriptional regulator with XRE-family HTH domain